MGKRFVLPALILTLITSLLLPLPAAVAQQGAIPKPPPPRIENPGPPSSPDAVWISGYWSWSRGQFRWVDGRWETPPAGRAYYVPGRWSKTKAGWRWQPGGWRR